jgi:NADH-quinone oxidoreductase subunit J
MILGTLFAIAALASVAGAIMAVAAKNPIRGAMALLLSILGVAGLLIGLHAQFLAMVELIVYAGAVVVLFVFVIMLVGPEPSSPLDWRGIIARGVAGLAAGVGAISIAIALSRMSGGPRRMPVAHKDLGTVEAIARELFTRDLVSFEIMTVLFVVAVVGAIALVRRRREPPSAKEDVP